MALLASRSRACVFWSRLLPRSSVVPQKTHERNVAVRSVQFPEYSLIFDFEKIRAASRFNKFKAKITVISAAGVSAAFLLQNLGYISPNFWDSCVFVGFGLTLFFHSVGVLFNNTIGYIYLKDDQQTVKISVAGYWGRRNNIDTSIENIQPFNDLPTYLWTNPWYQRVRLIDSKQTLKLYLSAGKILDEQIFTRIFGKVYS